MQKLGETGAEIDAFLEAPGRRVSLAAFASEIYAQRIVFHFASPMPKAPGYALATAVRGGLGRVLADFASPEAAAGRPCPYRPASAFDVAWRERRQAAGLAIPKPYVIGADETETGWCLHITLFGIATQWTLPFADAVFIALRRGIALRDGTALPAQIAGREISEIEGIGQASANFAQIEFLTPLRWRAQDGRFQIRSFLASAANRISGIGRWHGCEIAEDWARLPLISETLDHDASQLHALDVRRKSGTQSRNYDVEGYAGTLFMRGTPELWVDLLRLGGLAFVGSGASQGFGRYALALGDVPACGETRF